MAELLAHKGGVGMAPGSQYSAHISGWPDRKTSFSSVGWRRPYPLSVGQDSSTQQDTLGSHINVTSALTQSCLRVRATDSRAQWLTPVILAIPEAEVRIVVQEDCGSGGPGKR
jgi:hypothetical protein